MHQLIINCKIDSRFWYVLPQSEIFPGFSLLLTGAVRGANVGNMSIIGHVDAGDREFETLYLHAMSTHSKSGLQNRRKNPSC